MAGSRAPLRSGERRARARALGLSCDAAPAAPRRILVLHHLLLGDTLMLTALLAKLRARYPAAEIVMTVPRAYRAAVRRRGRTASTRILSIRAISPRSGRCCAQPRFDLAILPADNRWSWLARALGARWIVGIAGDRPAHKNWPVDELRPVLRGADGVLRNGGGAGDRAAAGALSRDGLARASRADDAPDFGANYAVLHVGASSPLKLWPAERWRALAAVARGARSRVVWSAGPGEDGDGRQPSTPTSARRAHRGHAVARGSCGTCCAQARLLVCPDTGIAHLGRLVGVPTVTLFGPGSAVICGPGEFFAGMPGRAVTVDPFPCRDQTIQFFREAWAPLRALWHARRCRAAVHGASSDRAAIESLFRDRHDDMRGTMTRLSRISPCTA